MHSRSRPARPVMGMRIANLYLTRLVRSNAVPGVTSCAGARVLVPSYFATFGGRSLADQYENSE
jgi:hypothetical protein